MLHNRKNTRNFVTMLNHRADFDVESKCHFLASSYVKRACDGVGGIVKRPASRAIK